MFQESKADTNKSEDNFPTQVKQFQDTVHLEGTKTHFITFSLPCRAMEEHNPSFVKVPPSQFSISLSLKKAACETDLPSVR